MWQINKYTNIRYHIYKELSKYRKLQEKRGSDRINEFAIPILTGIVVVITTNRLSHRFEVMSDFWFLGMVFAIIVGFISLLYLLKYLFFYYKYKIKPNRHPIITINFGDKDYYSRQEEDAAKFNYEVIYLVESAYSQANVINKEDRLLFKISFLNILFCTKNALRKMKESLLGSSGRINRYLVSDSMIKVALECIIATIEKVQRYDSDVICQYQDEIDFIKGLYDDTRRQIEIEYGIKLRRETMNIM